MQNKASTTEGQPPDVSIIVVNWNTRDVLRDCLNSIYEQQDGVHVEVIVIDNASTDGSAQMVKEQFPDVVLIENSENRGFAAANNQGMKIGKGRYVLLLNSDTIVLDDALRRALAFADSRPEAGVIGCRVLNRDRSLQPSCFRFPSLLNMFFLSTYLSKLFPRNRLFGREKMIWWERDDVRAVDVVTGCFMLVRREAIEKVGHMDENFFMYGEETDWCYRFKRAGWDVLFTPDAQIIHLGGGSSGQVRPKMVLQLRASILFFLKKHRGPIVYAAGCLLVALFFLLRIPYWLLKAISSKKMRRYSLQTAHTYAVGAFRALLGWRGLCVRS